MTFDMLAIFFYIFFGGLKWNKNTKIRVLIVCLEEVYPIRP